MTPHAATERRALAETLRGVGPVAPTLCGEWTAAQLAAHLVLRERSALEAARLLPIAPEGLRRRGEQDLARTAADTPFPELVAAVERGPSWRDRHGTVPVAWFWTLPGTDAINVVEFLVHHEDVRRAQPQWQPRALPDELQALLWRRLRLLAPATLRVLPVGVELVWPGHGRLRTLRARRHGAQVTVTGDPVELTLLAFGRAVHTTLDFAGSPDDVHTVRTTPVAV